MMSAGVQGDVVRRPAAQDADVNVRAMFDRIAGRYDTANRVMSGGIDIMWRKQAMKSLLRDAPENPVYLDLGAGTLDGTLEIARRHAGAQIVAADFAGAMLRQGQTKLGAHAGRIELHSADGHDLPYRAQAFDGAFSAFCVRNLVDLDRGLAELRRVVRPGCPVVVLEFFRPARTRWFMDRVWNGKVLPLVGWMVTGDRAAYRYLPDSIGRFDSRPEFEERLRRAGFADVSGRDFFPSAVASMVVAR